MDVTVGTVPLSKLAWQLQAQARRVDVAVKHAKLKAEQLGRPHRGAQPAVEAEAALQEAAQRLISARQAAVSAAARLDEEVRGMSYRYRSSGRVSTIVMMVPIRIQVALWKRYALMGKSLPASLIEALLRCFLHPEDFGTGCSAAS